MLYSERLTSRRDLSVHAFQNLKFAHLYLTSDDKYAEKVVSAQVGCSRGKAVAALKANNGDIVEAVTPLLRWIRSWLISWMRFFLLFLIG